MIYARCDASSDFDLKSVDRVRQGANKDMHDDSMTMLPMLRNSYPNPNPSVTLSDFSLNIERRDIERRESLLEEMLSHSTAFGSHSFYY